MPTQREAQTMQPWADAGAELELDWDEDMNLIGALFDDDNFMEEENYEEDIAGSGALAAWRRIEIARENRRLRSLLNDLDDYDDFEYLQEDYSAEYSY